jgi:hypothetical protein
MEQLKVGMNDLSSMAKKDVAAVASIHLKTVMASIHLEAAAATLEVARLRETLPTTSRVVAPYENPAT